MRAIYSVMRTWTEKNALSEPKEHLSVRAMRPEASGDLVTVKALEMIHKQGSQ